MRLTLRTLLAYLDDTLEPTEIKQIGQKVAESDAAQELIARIKQITRRRRLTTPPLSGPGAANFDPNTVAEYLDNALSGEQIAEVEKLCLESDVHLAEIATCHQILTLVLGEPALVPPTARERMYGLVQGKESIPFRKAAITTAPSAGAPNGSEDDDGPLGLTLMRRGGWPRWALPAAGGLLVIALVLTLFKVIPEARHNRQLAVNSTKKAEGEAATPVVEAPAEKPKEEPVKEKPPAAEAPAAEKPKPSAAANNGAAASKEPAPKEPAPKEPVTTTPVQQPVQQPGQQEAPTEQAGAPGTERREVGTYTVSPRSGPTLLVQRQGEQGLWRRLTPGTRIYSTDPLVSLPGYLSEVRLDSGAHLQMRGMIPAFATDPIMNILFDSAVVIHPSKDVDLDLTLNRGRIYLSNHKNQGPAHVRIRFDRETWVLTLAEPDSEAIVELLRAYSGDIRWREGEAPWTKVFLGFIKGSGTLKSDYRVFPMEMPGRALCIWDNQGAGLVGPISSQKPFAQWDKAAPMNKEADELSAALEELSKKMTEKKPVDVVLAEGLQADRFSSRLVAIYALGALGEVNRLLDVLGDEDGNRGADRNETVLVLRRWLSRGPEMGKQLYDVEKHAGLLTDGRKYLTGEAETLLKLLYGFSNAELRSPDTYRVLADYLRSPKIAIRELAIGTLVRNGAPVKYNPAWPDAERKKAAAEVEKMVDDHKLPPPQKAPAGPGGAAAPPGKSR